MRDEELSRMALVCATIKEFPKQMVIRRLEPDVDLPMIDLHLPSRWRWLLEDEPIVFHERIEFGVVFENSRGDEQRDQKIRVVCGEIEDYPAYLDEEASRLGDERGGKRKASLFERATSV